MKKKVTNFVLNRLQKKKHLLFRTNKEGRTIRKTRLRKFRTKSKKLIIAAQIVAIWYLLIISGSYLTTDTGAYFNDLEVIQNTLHANWEEKYPPDDGNWEKSSLQEVSQGGTCEKGIFASFTNTGESVDHELTKYEIYWSETGNPKNGEKVFEGTFPIPNNGEIYEIHYEPTKNGNYKFKAYHETGHANGNSVGKGPWSGTIELNCEVSQGKVNIIPEVQNLIANVNEKSVTLSWNNSKNTDYKKINIYRNNMLIESNIAVETYEDTGLALKTTYTYKITTVNSSKKESFGETIEVSTSGSADQPVEEEFDNHPPGDVTLVNKGWGQNGSSEKINLTWKNPTDSDLAGIIIYKNNVPVYKGNIITSYMDNDVKYDTPYTYKIVTFDTTVPQNESQGVVLSDVLIKK
ncbi:amyloid fiber anchoring/assembly protein TapA [Neobacillus sp. YX16]|uniref:amyloid fiber anchoring/assembly protein TapA n=1 Tax=Neobacillus sp. YX16 TaxID=3047874 RepID=UPI0024C36CF6|nr:amyloid fiber anchoring/assembly protein TapA [Neobacillus sp. YX16]WHZ01425.1 amyloid fiber anchoring/assembly protein TapA [Neobacillus sp. YX16]